MHPGLEGGVEELEPIIAYVEDDGITEKQMLQTETGSDPAEVEQVSATKQIHSFIANLL